MTRKEADRSEAADRAEVVRELLSRCHAELGYLESIPLSADDINAISSAKGFLERAKTILERVGQPEPS